MTPLACLYADANKKPAAHACKNPRACHCDKRGGDILHGRCYRWLSLLMRIRKNAMTGTRKSGAAMICALMQIPSQHRFPSVVNRGASDAFSIDIVSFFRYNKCVFKTGEAVCS